MYSEFMLLNINLDNLIRFYTTDKVKETQIERRPSIKRWRKECQCAKEESQGSIKLVFGATLEHTGHKAIYKTCHMTVVQHTRDLKCQHQKNLQLPVSQRHKASTTPHNSITDAFFHKDLHLQQFSSLFHWVPHAPQSLHFFAKANFKLLVFLYSK